ncbi:MAG: bifunctional DNA primase/polymerase [Nitrospinales bacterium]
MRATQKKPDAGTPGKVKQRFLDLTKTTKKDNACLQFALEYAQRGWPVLSIHSVKDMRCSCGKENCSSPGKHPRTSNGLKDATTDPGIIRQWFAQWPNANIAIRTGPESGLAVLDIDAKSFGHESIDALQREFGNLPDTLTAQTGGGGRHYFFRYPDCGFKNTAGKIAPGIDTRGDGGYVVVSPSIHASGRQYSWQDSEPGEIELAEVPSWLLVKLSQKAETQKNAEGNGGGKIPQGGRNEALTRMAGKMRHDGFEQSAIEAALVEHNIGKCKPPLPGEEVKKIAASISRYEPGPPEKNNGHEFRVTQWPAPPKDYAYQGLAGNIVRAIEPHTEGDPAALLVQLLVCFGNVIGRGPHFMAEADRHGTNLFACLVGSTAKGRKGTSKGHIRRLFKATSELWDKDCNHSGLSSGEGLIWVIRDKIIKSVFNKKTKTCEEEIVDFGVEDKRALVWETEFSNILQVLKREGNNLSPIIRNAWDGVDLRTMTKNSPARATEPHISIVGHITKDELLRQLDSTECGNGFANRFLWVCTRRVRLLPEGGRIHEVDFAPLVNRLGEVIGFAESAGELKRDDQARALWCEVYPDLSDGKPGLLGAVTARSEAQVMRLACLYALLDQSGEIKVEHLSAALALWEYCEASAKFIFGNSLGDPVADEIKRALSANPEGMTRTEISSLFGRNKNASQIGRALESLSASGLAFSEQEKTEGRTGQRWFLIKHSTKKTN